MMSKRDLDLIAKVIYEMPTARTSPHISDGNQRRKLALLFAKAIQERQPDLDVEAFVNKAVHNL